MILHERRRAYDKIAAIFDESNMDPRRVFIYGDGFVWLGWVHLEKSICIDAEEWWVLGFRYGLGYARRLKAL